MNDPFRLPPAFYDICCRTHSRPNVWRRIIESPSIFWMNYRHTKSVWLGLRLAWAVLM